MCVWTFRDQLCLNLVCNEGFYEKAVMDGFVGRWAPAPLPVGK
jgi:hypothetical protein